MADGRYVLWRDIWLVPLVTWAALCGLLAMTCVLAYVDLGGLNLAVSLCIAAVKAALVGAVFMHLGRGNALHRLAAAAGPLWLLIMFVLMGADFFTR